MSDILKDKTEQKGFYCIKFLPNLKNCENCGLQWHLLFFLQIEWNTRSLNIGIKYLSLSYHSDNEKYHEFRFVIKSKLLLIL